MPTATHAAAPAPPAAAAQVVSQSYDTHGQAAEMSVILCTAGCMCFYFTVRSGAECR